MTRRCPFDGNASNRRRLVSGNQTTVGHCDHRGPESRRGSASGWNISADSAWRVRSANARDTADSTSTSTARRSRSPRRPARALACRYSPVVTPAASARPRHHGADNGQRIGVGRQRHLRLAAGGPGPQAASPAHAADRASSSSWTMPDRRTSPVHDFRTNRSTSSRSRTPATSASTHICVLLAVCVWCVRRTHSADCGAVPPRPFPVLSARTRGLSLAWRNPGWRRDARPISDTKQRQALRPR